MKKRLYSSNEQIVYDNLNAAFTFVCYISSFPIYYIMYNSPSGLL